MEEFEDFEADNNTEATEAEAKEEKAKDEVAPEIEAAFVEAVNSEKDEDSVKIDMIGAGAKFKTVTKLYNTLMVKHGLLASKEEKQEAVVVAIKGVDLSTEEGLGVAVKALTEKLTNTNAKSAAGIIRAYAKKKEIEVYKKPKGEGGTRTTFLSEFYDALFANPNMTKEETHEFIKKHGTKNTLRWEATHQKVRALVNRIANAGRENQKPEPEAKTDKPAKRGRKKNGGDAEQPGAAA